MKSELEKQFDAYVASVYKLFIFSFITGSMVGFAVTYFVLHPKNFWV